MKHFRRQLLETLQSGTGLVTATVIRTSGSTPQKPGSTALFGPEGLLAGTVGGGLLEGEVTRKATDAMQTGVSGWYEFNLDATQGVEGAICGGEATVLVDAAPASHLEALRDMEHSLSQRKSGSILLRVYPKGNGGCEIRTDWIPRGSSPEPPEGLKPGTRKRIREMLGKDPRTGFEEVAVAAEEQEARTMMFLEHIDPLPHLVIAGAGHIGAALARLGSLLDFEVTVIDDRPEYANRAQIPDADHLVVDDIGTATGRLAGNPDSYVVIVTRGHQQDAEALKPCIGSNAAYVGMIGSRHKVAVMKKRFLDEGWSTREEWERIHAPIGIDIGSQTVQEIAVSIAAQLVKVRHAHAARNRE